MIIKQPGAEFFYEDVCYKIGDRIVGTDASEYQGLLGSIIEIVTVRIKKPKMKRRISIARLMPRFYPMTSQSWKSVFRNFINVKRRLRILFWMKSLWRRK